MLIKIDESCYIVYTMATFSLIVVLLLLRQVASINIPNIMDGCLQCAIQGDCTHAYQNDSGKLCRILEEGTPCCCGTEAMCVFDNMNHCGCQSSIAQLGSVKDLFAIIGINALVIIVATIIIITLMMTLFRLCIAFIHRNVYQPIV